MDKILIVLVEIDDVFNVESGFASRFAFLVSAPNERLSDEQVLCLGRFSATFYRLGVESGHDLFVDISWRVVIAKKGSCPSAAVMRLVHLSRSVG